MHLALIYPGAPHRKEIIRTMESFNNNLQGGKKLVKSLEKQSVLSPRP